MTIKMNAKQQKFESYSLRDVQHKKTISKILAKSFT